MSNPLIHTILISTATGDGQIVGLTRTRNADQCVVADMVESCDYDCFDTTSFQNKPGIQHEIITQRSPNHSIPDRVWHDFFDLLCMRLQMQAVLRHTTITKDQENLGSITHHSNANAVGLVLCMPKNTNSNEVIINGQSMSQVLESLNLSDTPTKLKPNPQPQPKPPTWDPHYKDSAYPDDYIEERDEPNDCPF